MRSEPRHPRRASARLAPLAAGLTPLAAGLTPLAAGLTPLAAGLTPFVVRLTPFVVRLTPFVVRLTPLAVRLPLLALGLALLPLGLGGCVEGGVVLERAFVDGSVSDVGLPDSGTPLDGGLPDASTPPDDGVDAGPTGNVTLYLTGFDAYAGLTIRARLGALSSVIASAVIQPDGTAVLILNQVFTILSSTYFESYVDVDGSGTCSSANDALAASNVVLVQDGENWRVTLDASSTSAPLLGCLALN